MLVAWTSLPFSPKNTGLKALKSLRHHSHAINVPSHYAWACILLTVFLYPLTFNHEAKSCGCKLPFYLQAGTISNYGAVSNKVGCCIRETNKSNVCVLFLLGEPPLLQVDTDGDNSLSSFNSLRDNIKGHDPGPSADIIHSHSHSDVSLRKNTLINDVLTMTYFICFCLTRYVSRLTDQISMQSIDFLCIFLSF